MNEMRLRSRPIRRPHPLSFIIRRSSQFIIHHSSYIILSFLLLAACTPRQEGERIEDVEPERLINTDLSYPKNPQRWAYVSAKVSTDPKDPFAGFRVVVANPFLAHALEEGRKTDRGAKYAQFVYETAQTPNGIAPGQLRRVNIVVQDPERYAATGGWGFASFDGLGRTIAIEPRNECIVCHTAGPVSASYRR